MFTGSNVNVVLKRNVRKEIYTREEGPKSVPIHPTLFQETSAFLVDTNLPQTCYSVAQNQVQNQSSCLSFETCPSYRFPYFNIFPVNHQFPRKPRQKLQSFFIHHS